MVSQALCSRTDTLGMFRSEFRPLEMNSHIFSLVSPPYRKMSMSARPPTDSSPGWITQQKAHAFLCGCLHTEHQAKPKHIKPFEHQPWHSLSLVLILTWVPVESRMLGHSLPIVMSGMLQRSCLVRAPTPLPLPTQGAHRIMWHGLLNCRQPWPR